jgi:hypothetical protein
MARPVSLSPTVTRRRRTRRKKATATGSAQALLSHVKSIVAENKALAADAARVRQLLAKMVTTLSEASGAGVAVIRAGRSSAGRVPLNGRRKRRIRVSSPETLERRRAALAKARAVLAAKRAAAKRSR